MKLLGFLIHSIHIYGVLTLRIEQRDAEVLLMYKTDKFLFYGVYHPSRKTKINQIIIQVTI